MSDDDTNDQPEMQGFAIPLPPGLIEAALNSHAQDHMRSHDLRNRVFEFIESLTVEQLMTWRHMLNTSPKRAFAYNQYVDGLVVMCLRKQHDVDPDHPFESVLPE